LCQVCGDIFEDPHMPSSGCDHKYCYPCIRGKLRTANQCPVCRLPLAPRDLKKCHKLGELLKEFRIMNTAYTKLLSLIPTTGRPDKPTPTSKIQENKAPRGFDTDDNEEAERPDSQAAGGDDMGEEETASHREPFETGDGERVALVASPIVLPESPSSQEDDHGEDEPDVDSISPQGILKYGDENDKEEETLDELPESLPFRSDAKSSRDGPYEIEETQFDSLSEGNDPALVASQQSASPSRRLSFGAQKADRSYPQGDSESASLASLSQQSAGGNEAGGVEFTELERLAAELEHEEMEVLRYQKIIEEKRRRKRMRDGNVRGDSPVCGGRRAEADVDDEGEADEEGDNDDETLVESESQERFTRKRQRRGQEDSMDAIDDEFASEDETSSDKNQFLVPQRLLRSPKRQDDRPNIVTNKTVVLVASMLTPPQRSLVRHFQEWKGWEECGYSVRVERTVTPETTHLITQQGGGGSGSSTPCCRRTMKFFQAVAVHAWVVDIMWVSTSLADNELKVEEEFEFVAGDRDPTPEMVYVPMRSENLLMGGARKSRMERFPNRTFVDMAKGFPTGGSDLLSSYNLYIYRNFKTVKMDRKDLVALAELAGATVLPNSDWTQLQATQHARKDSRDGKTTLLVCPLKGLMKSTVESFEESVPVVSHCWLLDSVSTCNAIDHTKESYKICQ
jgi:hypothetical protein